MPSRTQKVITYFRIYISPWPASVDGTSSIVHAALAPQYVKGVQGLVLIKFATMSTSNVGAGTYLSSYLICFAQRTCSLCVLQIAGLLNFVSSQCQICDFVLSIRFFQQIGTLIFDFTIMQYRQQAHQDSCLPTAFIAKTDIN